MVFPIYHQGSEGDAGTHLLASSSSILFLYCAAARKCRCFVSIWVVHVFADARSEGTINYSVSLTDGSELETSVGAERIASRDAVYWEATPAASLAISPFL